VGIGQKELVKGLSEALKAGCSRPTLPILAGVNLEVKSGNLSLTCTDLDQYLTVKRPAPGLPDGQIIINGKEVTNLLKTFPAGDIDIQFEPGPDARKPGAVTFRQGRIESKVKGLAINEDWPIMPEPSDPVRFTITPEKLTECIKHVQDVVVFDDNKPNLSGIFFTAESGKLAAVTTDTRRLARYAVDVPELPEEIKFILPLATAEMVPGLFKNDAGLTISIYPGPKAEKESGSIAPEEKPRPEYISFDSGDKNLLVRLIDGEFPDYHQVVQDVTEFPRVNLPSKEITAALKRIETLVSKGKNIVILEVSGNVLKLSGELEDTTISETFDVVFPFPDVYAGFNPGYLIDGIKAAGGDNFTLYLNPNQEKPSTIKPDPETGEYLYLVMAVRVEKPLTEEEKAAKEKAEKEEEEREAAEEEAKRKFGLFSYRKSDDKLMDGETAYFFEPEYFETQEEGLNRGDEFFRNWDKEDQEMYYMELWAKGEDGTWGNTGEPVKQWEDVTVPEPASELAAVSA
jgi:DNA polymerase-3 subunit beta